MKFSKIKNRSKPNNIFVALSVFVVIKQARFRQSKVNTVCQLLQQDSFMCWTKI